MIIGFKGDLIDLVIKQGSQFTADGIVSNPDGTALDISTATITAVMKKKFDSVDLVTFTSTITNGMSGMYSIGLNGAQTSALEAGSTENDPKSKYIWEMSLTEANGRVYPLTYGEVHVFRKLKTY